MRRVVFSMTMPGRQTGVSSSRLGIRPFNVRGFSSAPVAEKAVEAAAAEPGFFYSLALAGSDMYEALHAWTSVPYWGVIVGTTLAFRVAIAPFMVISMKNAVRMQDAKPEMELLSAELRRAGSSVEARTKYYEELKKIQKKHDFSMTRSFLPMFIQMPMFIWFFGSVRALLDTVPELTTGGALWFADLTARDPLLRLNVLTALVMYGSFRYGAETGGLQGPQAGIMKTLAVVFPILYLPLTYNFGQGLHLFWLTGSVAAISLNYMLRSTPVGAMLGIPKPKAAILPTPPMQAFSTKSEALKGKSASQLAKEHKKNHD